MLIRLADWCYRRRRLVVLGWLGALLGAYVLAGAFGGDYRQDYLQPGSESEAAADTLEERFPQAAGDTMQIVVHAEQGVTSAAAQATAEEVFDDVAGDPHVLAVASPYDEGGAAQISDDGRTAYADVALDRPADDFTPAEAKEIVAPVLAAGTDTVQVEAGARWPALPDRTGRVRGDRPAGRGPHPAPHLRLRGGHGPAFGHRGLRPGGRAGAR